MFSAVGRSIWFGLLPVLLTLVGYLFILLGIFILPLSIIGLLLCLLAFVLYMIFLGIAAWGGGGKSEPVKPAMKKR